MPSARKIKRICLFGDSALAAYRHALTEGLVQLPGIEVEFFGAPGPSFRSFESLNGRIVPGPEALPALSLVNGAGRTSLGPDDFDAFLFIGARLGAADFVAAHIHLARGSALPSRAVQEAMAYDFLIRVRAWRFARDFARHRPVMFIPTPYPTEGILDLSARNRLFAYYPRAEFATVADRARAWQMLMDVSQKSGVPLLAQPDHTVTRGVLTQARYATKDAAAKEDISHKSPEFAALMLQNWYVLWQNRAKIDA